MEINLLKSGVICFSENEEVLHRHQETEYVITCGVIPKVAKYKYLGIFVDNTLGDSRGRNKGANSVERQHVKSQSVKGMKALGSLKPMLKDKICHV